MRRDGAKDRRFSARATAEALTKGHARVGGARALAVDDRPRANRDRALLVGLARELALPICPILQSWAELDDAYERRRRCI